MVKQLVDWQNSVPGITLHIIVQVVVVLGVPVGGFFANRILETEHRVTIIETKMVDGHERRFQQIEGNLDKIEKKLDVILDEIRSKP